MKKVNKKVIIPAILLLVLFLLVVFSISSKSSQFLKGVDSDEIKIIETSDRGTGMDDLETEKAEIHYVN